MMKTKLQDTSIYRLQDTSIYRLREPSPDPDNWLIDGKPGGKLAILLSMKGDKLNEDQQTLLHKMITAIGFSPDAVSVYQVPENESVPFHWVKKALAPQYVIAFGIDAAKLHLNASLEQYQHASLAGTSLLLAPALESLTGSPAKKETLWKAFQQMFNLA